MEWGFIWLMFLLKIPIIALLLLVWWAIKQEVELDEPGDGGIGDRPKPRHPRVPRRYPRGPHGDPAPLPSPPRVRTVRARGRTVHRQD